MTFQIPAVFKEFKQKHWCVYYMYKGIIFVGIIFPYILKVKVIPYTFVLRGVPVREVTYPEPLACEALRQQLMLSIFVME